MAETETLRIPIGLDTKEVQSDARSIAKMVRDAFDSEALKNPNKELQQIAYNMKQALQQVTDLSAELEVVKNTEIPTEQFKEYQEAANEAKVELLKLDAAAKAFLDAGGKESDPFFQGLVSKAEEAIQRLDTAEDKMDGLKKSGEAFTIDTKKVEELNGKLDVATDKLKIQYGNYQDIIKKQRESNKEASKLPKYIDEAKKSSGGLSSTFKRIATRLFGLTAVIAIIRKAFRAFISSAKEGFTNLTKESTRAASNLNLLTAKFLQLRNSIGAAVAPLLSMVVPVITKIIDLFTRAFNAVAKFFALLGGNKTVSVAKTLDETAAAAAGKSGGGGGGGKKGKTAEEKYQEAVEKAQLKYEKELAKYNDKVAKAEKKQADAAAKLAKEQEEANGQLASFDELNNLTQDSIDDTIDDMEDFSDEMPTLEMPEMDMDDLGGGGAGLVDMFEDIPVDENLPKWLQDIIDKLKELKDIFLKGFFDGLGDWKTRLDDIIKNLGIIKDALIDIWTDPAVLTAADRWLKSLVYMLGSLVGSIASIGLTIAQNLVGGMAKYLSENKDRIKEYLIAMFDIGADINELLATLFQDIAYIFEAYGQENGQRLTANIIGVFADGFMGITELYGKFTRDTLDVFITTLHEHRDDIKQVFDDLLGWAAGLTGVAKEFIDTLADSANALYDEHLKPVFDEIKIIVGDLVDTFMRWWNEFLKPLMDDIVGAVQEIWQNVQPVITELYEAIGAGIDAILAVLTPFWENFLKPFLDWLLTYIAPVVLTLWQNVVTTVKNAVNNIMNIIRPIISFIKDVFKLIKDIVNGDWDAAWQDCKNILQDVWDYVKGVFDFWVNLVIDILSTIWNVFQSAFVKIGDGVMNLVNKIADFIKNIKDKISEFASWFKEKRDNIKQDIIDFITKVKEDFMAKIEEWFGKLKEFKDNVVGGLTEMLDKVTEWKENITDLIGQAVDFVIGLFEKLAGWIDDIGEKFSGFADKVSNFSFTDTMSNAGTWISGKINGYAGGQVIPPNMAAHLAVLGDNNRETEVVSPLSTMKEAMIEALATANISNNGSNAPIIVQIDGREVFRAVRDQNDIYYNQTGLSAFA